MLPWIRLLLPWVLAARAAASAGRRLGITRSSLRKLETMCKAEGRERHHLLSTWINGIWQSAGLSVERTRSGTDVTSSDGAAYGQILQEWQERRAAIDAKPRQYTLKLDGAKLKALAGAQRRLVVTWTTGGPKRWSIAHNLGLSIRKNTPDLEDIFVFIALDQDAVLRAKEAGFHVVLNEAVGPTDLQDDIWKMRWLIQTTCIALDLEVLVVDSDIVFLSNPFPYFFGDSDLEAMTDHFFPEKHLWATWLRPAEHINTGFLLARPSVKLFEFLVEFIDSHYEAYEGPTLRDGMDQRVFNKFVMSKMEGPSPCVVSRYENLTFERLDWQHDTGPVPRFLPADQWRFPSPGRRSCGVTLRLLDPVCISHGMNYFWRKAYKLSKCGGQSGGKPAVVHVNGVDPKMYFLRDRNLWYVDDWDQRFDDSSAFMVYEHPKSLPLADDFEVLVAALELGAYFRRRVVLPETMNCANSPTYRIYNLSETMADEAGCTYDYFAHANGLYEVYSRQKPFAIEAGLAREPRFQGLSRKVLSSRELQSSLRSELLREDTEPTSSPVTAAFGPEQVLHLKEDVRALRDALRRGDFGLRMNSERVVSCAYQEPLIGAMACLDEPYVEEFGTASMCDSFSPGCGPVGICCCWPFWGWGEKLQYFTGVPWDLPCNCGLSLCEAYDRPKEEGAAERCCRHSGSTALFPVTDPGVFYCKSNSSWSGPTGAEDSNTYTSQALVEFAANKRTAAQSFQTCSLDRLLRRGDAFREASLRECNIQFSSYLLRRGRWSRLRVWWDWIFEERRSLGNASRLIARMDGEVTTDNAGFSAGKLAHDLEQLEFIASSGGSPAGGAVTEALAAFQRLQDLFSRFQQGLASREEVQLQFYEVRPFFNRAVHVPDFSKDLSALGGFLADADWSGAESQLLQKGVAVLDGVFTEPALNLVHRWLTTSTVWFQSMQEGQLMKAQLRDGLHALGLPLLQALQEKWPFLLQYPALDLVAYRHRRATPPELRLPWHCVDGRLAAVLCLGDAADAVVKISSAVSLCKDTLVGPAPALNLEEFVQRVAVSPPDDSTRSLRCSRNRMILWHPAHYAVALEGAGGATFAQRPMELMALWGENRAKVSKTPNFEPSFEGKTDRWGDHYYAQDHDHR